MQQGHHLILGKLTDFLTGDVIDDTHDERLRQGIALYLVNQKGYDKIDITPRIKLLAQAGNKKAVIFIDFIVALDDIICMMIKYGPGSLVTRHRPALAASRLIAPYQIPIIVVTNGIDADILDGATGKVLSSGKESIPDKEELKRICCQYHRTPISSQRSELEARILYAYEVDGTCPCDESICRLSGEDGTE